MKRFLVVVAILSIFISHSCSKSVPEVNGATYEQQSFLAWMAAYEPDAIPFNDSLHGFYKLYPANISSESVEEGDWVNITYTGQTLDGQYFKNYYKSLSYTLGTFKNYAHYIPMFGVVDSTYTYYITKGMHKALAMMSPGDSVSLFLSSEYAYGGSGTTVTTDGFHGDEISIASYQPVKIGMRLDEIIKDPLAREQALVEEYAKNVLKLATYDSIADGLYMKILTANPEGDSINDDSVVYVRYTGYFLDGFVFDTNIEDVADEAGISYSEDLLTFQAAGSSGEATTTIESWNEAIVNMRKGETATIVSTSSWAYSSTGVVGDTTTIIYPYTPLVFDVRVLTDEEYEEEE